PWLKESDKIGPVLLPENRHPFIQPFANPGSGLSVRIIVCGIPFPFLVKFGMQQRAVGLELLKHQKADAFIGMCYFYIYVCIFIICIHTEEQVPDSCFIVDPVYFLSVLAGH